MKMKGKHASLILNFIAFFLLLEFQKQKLFITKKYLELKFSKLITNNIDMDHGFHWSKMIIDLNRNLFQNY